jgi:hypothetical protein
MKATRVLSVIAIIVSVACAEEDGSQRSSRMTGQSLTPVASRREACHGTAWLSMASA